MRAGEVGQYKDTDISIWKKANTASSKILPGIVVHRDNSTGIGAACSAGDFGDFGVITEFEPINADADPTMAVLDGADAEVYVTFSSTNTVHGGQDVVADDNGKVKGYVESAEVDTSPGDFQVPLREDSKKIGKYVGKDDTEGQGLDKPATDITDAVGRIKLY